MYFTELTKGAAGSVLKEDIVENDLEIELI